MLDKKLFSATLTTIMDHTSALSICDSFIIMVMYFGQVTPLQCYSGDNYGLYLCSL